MTTKRTKRAANTQAATSTVDVSRQLDALQVAKKAGVLTEAEYERKRVPLLNALHEIDGLERQALAAGGVPLGVTINTPLVVAGELIESAWGNQVRTDLFSLNSGKVEKTGDSMTGSLTLSGGSSQVVLPNDPTTTTHAARKNYVDNRDALKLNLTGGQLSGNLIVGDDPATWQGVQLRSGTGQILSNLVGTTSGGASSLTSINLSLIRTGPPASDVGGIFTSYRRTAGGAGTDVEIGSVKIATTTSVAYNTTSDPRAKSRTGSADDVAELVQSLGSRAYRGRWRNIDTDEPEGDEWVMLNSTDVEEFAPYAVDGEADAVDANDRPVFQQVNWPGLVPMLFAALSQALARIDVLEARIG